MLTGTSRIISLGAYWMTGGVGLPMTTEARETAYRRLAAEGLLVDGTVTDRRRMALIMVRACLETGAAEHVAYEDPGDRARRDEHCGPCAAAIHPSPRPQRRLPLRQRQEVQEALWGHYRVAHDFVTDETPSRKGGVCRAGKVNEPT